MRDRSPKRKNGHAMPLVLQVFEKYRPKKQRPCARVVNGE